MPGYWMKESMEYYLALGVALQEKQDNVPFEHKIKNARENYIKHTMNVPTSILTEGLPIYEFTFHLLLHITYFDDHKIDKVEKKLIQSLYLTKSKTMDPETIKRFQKLMKQKITVSDLIAYIKEHRLTPIAILRSMDMVITYVDLRSSYSDSINTLFDTFADLDY